MSHKNRRQDDQVIERYRDLAGHLVREAGAVLLKYFGRIRNVRQKEHPSSVVCEADIASEQLIIQKIRASFPEDGILAEESGWVRGSSRYTWVIDPLDGTSNFVAGLPWFGAQIGVLRGTRPIAAAMFLPVEGHHYSAALGGGVRKNERPLKLTRRAALKKSLCAFGFDATATKRETLNNARLLMRVAGATRNTRATNSLFDFVYTLEGRFGGCINLNCKIWDIVPISLMLPEAGGRFTNLTGQPIRFEIDLQCVSRNFRVLGASRHLHRELIRITNPGRTGSSH